MLKASSTENNLWTLQWPWSVVPRKMYFVKNGVMLREIIPRDNFGYLIEVYKISSSFTIGWWNSCQNNE